MNRFGPSGPPQDGPWQMVDGKWRYISAPAPVPPPVADTRAIEDAAIAKAFGATMDALLHEDAVSKSSAATQFIANTPGSWSNLGGTANRLIGRVTGNLARQFNRPPKDIEDALARQGMTWGPPFSPGRPLDPFNGQYRVPPRDRQYSVGENTQIVPRWGRISYKTIRALWEAYDVAQICTQHLINDVVSLDYHFEAALGVREDVSAEVVKAREFFDAPDKEQPFRSWLFEFLMNVVQLDCGALYIRRSQGDAPLALEVVDGATIVKLIDYWGRLPSDEDDSDAKLTPAGVYEGKIVPAYAQIIDGLVWDWLAKDDMIYQPWHPQPNSQYGRCALEAVLLTANTDMRFQWHFLNYFTQGSLPAGFMQAPEGMTNPAQIAEWQETWDSFMLGDQAKLRQIRWVPHDATFQPVGPAKDDFNAEFPLYLMRRVCAAFGITPADLGFTETVNKATSETQVDVQFRVGTLPLVRYVEDVINLFLSQHLKLRVRLRFDTGREIEDRLATAQAESFYIRSGVISADEPRTRLGYPIDLNKPTPRFIDNTRSGPIPLNALLSMAGKIDPETYGPAKDQPLVDHPFVPIPGVMPVIEANDYKAAMNASAMMQANMIAAANGEKLPFPEVTNIDTANAEPASMAPAEDDIEKALAQIDQALAWVALAKDGGPTAGITASTGMYGVDLRRDDEDEEEEDAEKALRIAAQLRQWRENSRNRIRKGLAPRRFVSADLPQELVDGIWSDLQGATSREAIDRAFKAADPKAPARSKPGSAEVREALASLLSDGVIRDAIRAAIEAAQPVEKATDDQGRTRNAALSVLLAAELAVAALLRALMALWQGGAPEAAEAVANGLAHAMVFEIADVIANQAMGGATENAVYGAVADAIEKRAALITQVERAKAAHAVAMDEYRDNGTQRITWVGGRCARCRANAAAGPIGINDSWPEGPPPVHPGCDCGVAPV